MEKTAQEDPDSSVRRSAVRHISDTDVLRGILQHDSDQSVLETAEIQREKLLGQKPGS